MPHTFTTPPLDPWLTPREATEEYKISKATLSEMRAKRIGPAFRQIGRAIHYRKSVFDVWVDSCVIQTPS